MQAPFFNDQHNQRMWDSGFSDLSDDVVLIILYKLEDDPRNWARLACVSTKFSSIIRTVCFRSKCLQSIPAVVSDLLSSADSAPAGVWASLYKLSTCCPGLLSSGVLLDNSDFGLEREIGPDLNPLHQQPNESGKADALPCSSGGEFDPSASGCGWSLYDDLFSETLYSDEGYTFPDEKPEANPESADIIITEFASVGKRRRSCGSHLASGIWKLSREQGKKLLASRFKGDCLYISEWPGCIHVEEKRKYMLFRGVFNKFKQSGVWRAIRDGIRRETDLRCAYCSSVLTWDLHSSFCLRRYFGFHDDGEPVVRAYVCENGHVSGAWTDWPLFT